MATNQNLKDALTFPAEVGNPITDVARTVGNGALIRLAEALEDRYLISQELGRPPNADDAARWLYTRAHTFVSQYEGRKAKDTLPSLPDFEG
jgi:hypothetical protein